MFKIYKGQFTTLVTTHRGGASLLPQFDGDIAAHGGHGLSPPGPPAAARLPVVHGGTSAPLPVPAPVSVPVLVPVPVSVRVRVVSQQAAALASCSNDIWY